MRHPGASSIQCGPLNLIQKKNKKNISFIQTLLNIKNNMYDIEIEIAIGVHLNAQTMAVICILEQTCIYYHEKITFCQLKTA